MELPCVVNLLSPLRFCPSAMGGGADRGYVAGDQADGFLALTHPENRESRAQ